MLLLRQDTTRDGRVDKIYQLTLDKNNNKEYKVNKIWDNKVYAKEPEGHLPGLYYLVSGKGYAKK